MFFPQVRVPGEIVQVDWTHAEELGVCLGGRKFPCPNQFPRAPLRGECSDISPSSASAIIG